MRSSIVILSIGLVMAVGSIHVVGQDSTDRCDSKEKLTPEVEALWQSRFEEIQKEITSLKDHPWAGAYYYGDGLGVNSSLTLAPKSGCVFLWTGCMGVYDRNFGTVTPTERGSIRLAFHFKNCRRGFQGADEEFVPIAWGDRHYLIPSDQVIDFCNFFNSGMEPRNQAHGSFLLRQGDHEKSVSGSPTLPEEYQAYLLSEPVLAQIVSVGATRTEEQRKGWGFQKTNVTLNVGRANKILPGMTFRICEPRDCYVDGKISVLSVSENASEALITQFKDENITRPTPAIGWRLSTASCDRPETQPAQKR